MANGSPGENIHDVEPHRIVRFQQTQILLRPRISCLEVRHPVLLRQPLLRHVLPLKVEEHEPPHEQRQSCAQADHHLRIQLRLDVAAQPPLLSPGVEVDDRSG
ncbi:unnamed protein product [Cuscuta epithymum]|uniref:Uncharacterized protein n=1 Tax=Cuscuta epithymum TaxID=186058 RepID=A0AAV0EYU0_9ASTE|nr:unnamed protein product [Cuscuta epithymum]